MKKFLSVFFSVCCLYMIAVPADAAKPKAKHIIYIGLDGWGGYSLPKANMPTVKQMMQNGCYTLEKRAVLPSSSAVNWASMFMGAGPEIHGYTEWNSQVPELPSRVVYKHNIFPTIFQLYRDKDPNAELGVIYEWEGIKYVVDTLALNYYEQAPDFQKYPTALVEMAEKYIKTKKPNLFAICFDNPDHVGHAIGHDTPEYYQVLNELDGYIARIVQAAKEAGIYDDTIFMLSSDHGGINKGHGGKTMVEMQTPFIICGKGIKKGGLIGDSMMQFDVASTMAYILQIKQPQVWIGRPMLSVFK